MTLININQSALVGGGTTESRMSPNIENQTVTIFDARKVSPGSFYETGFTLIKLDKVHLIFCLSKYF